MPGFRITDVNTDASLNDVNFSNLITDSITCDKWKINRSTLDKFQQDKLFDEEKYYVIVLEGVILNKSDIIRKYKKGSWLDTVIYLIENNDETWFSELTGPFSGAVYYKNEKKWCIFTGKLGEKAVFYWTNGEETIVGSMLIYLTDIMREHDIERVADEDALCRFAAYGTYIGNETCLKHVKRLYPGEYLIISDEGISVQSYYLMDYRQDEGNGIRSEKEYIDLLQDSFLKAMQRIIDKNREYGYKTLVDISGGYDSRLNAYVLNDLADENDKIIADCYGQSGCHDAIVSEQIASELGFTYFFMSLDNASCMYGLDENIKMLSGATFYSGISGGRDILNILSGYNVGLEVTGLLGDIHDGSMVVNYSDAPIDTKLYRESLSVTEGKDFSFPLEENYRFNHHINEHFWFYNRGMIGGMGSFLIRQNFVEPVTPYGDPEFVKVYLSIPWKIRVDGRLLRRWLIEKYPQSGKYTNGRTGIKLKNELGIKGFLLSKVMKQIKKYQRLWKVNKGQPSGMCDVSSWYRNNTKFRAYVDDNLYSEMDSIKKYPSVYATMNKLNKSGNVHDKIIMISINSIFRTFIV